MQSLVCRTERTTSVGAACGTVVVDAEAFWRQCVVVAGIAVPYAVGVSVATTMADGYEPCSVICQCELVKNNGDDILVKTSPAS